jgi:cysteine desulfurase
MPHSPVYLDYHATTPVDPRVVEAMLPYFTERFGNPASSSHQWGWQAREGVEQARREVAALIGATPREIVFTSGATESNNLALAGFAEAGPADRRHVVASAIEHKSVLEPARRLETLGWRVDVVPVRPDGRIDLGALRALVTTGTALVSVMAANNEIGVLQPLDEVAAVAHEAGAVLHVDAAQAAGKIPIDVNAIGVDLLALTAHKIYGPKGAGALFVRRRISIAPILRGGGHERGLRSGTLNVPGIVGLGAACALCRAEMDADAVRMARQRDRLLAGLRAGIPGLHVTGSLEHRLPNNLHVSIEGVDGESLVIGLSDLAVSTGSACSSPSAEPSHVLAALGSRAALDASIRFGLGRFTTDDEIEYAIERVVAVVRHLQETQRLRA